MRLRFHSIGIVLLCVLVPSLEGCRPDTARDGLLERPEVKEADRRYAGVFKPLDGVWKGTFHIYEDPSGQGEGPARPEDVDRLDFDPSSFRRIQSIEVTQEYASESPYFQRVIMTDTYEDGRTERSRGVNKVQEGKLWCVVIKPEETVVHEGALDGENTIIWRRSQTRPLKMEYFRETVEGGRYTIRGWGYFGSDDPERAPRIWFSGDYSRAKPSP